MRGCNARINSLMPKLSQQVVFQGYRLLHAYILSISRYKYYTVSFLSGDHAIHNIARGTATSHTDQSF